MWFDNNEDKMTPTNPFDQQKQIPGVKNIIAVASGKGGVGKSTISVNIAAALSELGYKTGLLDADIYGPSIPRMFGAINQKMEIESTNMLKPIERSGVKLASLGFLVEEDIAVVWRGPMLFKAMNQFLFEVNWGELDYLVIDLPPGTGDVQLSLVQKVPVSKAIIVSTPQNIALSDAKKAIDMFQRVNVPIVGIVENMSYLETTSGEKQNFFPKGELDSYIDSQKIKKLIQVPLKPELAQACEAGVPFVKMYKTASLTKDFLDLAQKII